MKDSGVMRRTTMIDIMTGIAAGAAVSCVFAFALGAEKTGAVLAGVACVLIFAAIPVAERKGGAR